MGTLTEEGAMKILKHMAHHKINSKELSDMPIVTDEKYGQDVHHDG